MLESKNENATVFIYHSFHVPDALKGVVKATIEILNKPRLERLAIGDRFRIDAIRGSEFASCKEQQLEKHS